MTTVVSLPRWPYALPQPARSRRVRNVDLAVRRSAHAASSRLAAAASALHRLQGFAAAAAAAASAASLLLRGRDMPARLSTEHWLGQVALACWRARWFYGALQRSACSTLWNSFQSHACFVEQRSPCSPLSVYVNKRTRAAHCTHRDCVAAAHDASRGEGCIPRRSGRTEVRFVGARARAATGKKSHSLDFHRRTLLAPCNLATYRARVFARMLSVAPTSLFVFLRGARSVPSTYVQPGRLGWQAQAIVESTDNAMAHAARQERIQVFVSLRRLELRVGESVARNAGPPTATKAACPHGAHPCTSQAVPARFSGVLRAAMCNAPSSHQLITSWQQRNYSIRMCAWPMITRVQRAEGARIWHIHEVAFSRITVFS